MAEPSATRQHLGRVLVADDDEAIRKVCTRVLGNEGWHVTTCESGREAIAETERATVPFDCVLSDVNMPEMDGFELVRTLREKDDELPVLLMTGDPSLDGAVRAIDHGAVSYIAKPFDHESLASQVARAARRHGVRRMRRRAASWARDTRELERIQTRFACAVASSWMAFQPIVDVTRKQIFAYEALLRTDEESMRRPDIFISTAERLDQVQLLGRTVREAVAREAAALPAGANVFVNVHGLELTDEELFSASSELAAIAPRVVLEITERIGIDPVAGAERVAMLRRLGYRIAVDDLGAGYAALGALATLEPEIVKLDMSLIRELDRHDKKRRIVTAIAGLCRELGSRVVAEGVETHGEKQACIDAGIELLQGYLYARPARGFAPVAF